MSVRESGPERSLTVPTEKTVARRAFSRRPSTCVQTSSSLSIFMWGLLLLFPQISVGPLRWSRPFSSLFFDMVICGHLVGNGWDLLVTVARVFLTKRLYCGRSTYTVIIAWTTLLYPSSVFCVAVYVMGVFLNMILSWNNFFSGNYNF